MGKGLRELFRGKRDTSRGFGRRSHLFRYGEGGCKAWPRRKKRGSLRTSRTSRIGKSRKSPAGKEATRYGAGNVVESEKDEQKMKEVTLLEKHRCVVGP